MMCSMSRKGNCDDHAVVERVFRSLKEEGFTEDPPDTRDEATLSVIDYLIMFYNSQRLHSTLGYQSPKTFEAQAAKSDQGVQYRPNHDRPVRSEYGRHIFPLPRQNPQREPSGRIHTIPFSPCPFSLDHYNVPPLWGDRETDRQHWKRMLALRTVELTHENFTNELRNNLAMLKLASEKAEENHLFHLDFHPKNILVSQETIGVIDFEWSASVGDPAYDIGAFLGQYIYWSIMNMSDQVSQNAIQLILETYQHHVGDLWNTRQSRVVGFAGATILSLLLDKNSTARQKYSLVYGSGLSFMEWPFSGQCQPRPPQS